MEPSQSETGVMTRAQFRRLSLNQSASFVKIQSPIKNSGKKTPKKTPSKSINNAKTATDLHQSPLDKTTLTGRRLSSKIKNANANNEQLLEGLSEISSPKNIGRSPLSSKLSSIEDVEIEKMSESNRKMNSPEKRNKRKSKGFKGALHGSIETVNDTDQVLDGIDDEITKEQNLLLLEEPAFALHDTTSSVKKKKSSNVRKSKGSLETVNGTDGGKDANDDEVKEEQDWLLLEDAALHDTSSVKKKRSSKVRKSTDVSDVISVEEIKEEEDSSVVGLPRDNIDAVDTSSTKTKKSLHKRMSKGVQDEMLLEEDEIKEEDDIKEEDCQVGLTTDNSAAVNIFSSKKKKSSKKRDSIEPLIDVRVNKDAKSDTKDLLIDVGLPVVKDHDKELVITSPKKLTPKKLSRENVDGNLCITSENSPQKLKTVKGDVQDVKTIQNKQSRSSFPELVGKVPCSTLESRSVSKKTVIEDDSDSDDDSDAECRKEIMRSAEKRIIRNISTSESESRNVKTLLFNKDNTGVESDSAPEDITFDASRKSALDLLKHTVDSIKRDKLKKKEQRKERLEMLRLRKEENLIRLKERRANQEDASCSSSEESVHERQIQLNKYNDLLSKGKKTYFVEESSGKNVVSSKHPASKMVPMSEKQSSGLKRLPSELLENLPDQLPKKMKMSYQAPSAKPIQSSDRLEVVKDSVSKHKRDVDFIPIDANCATQFGVVALDKPKLKTVAQQAADFRHNMLYGSRVSRVPGNTYVKYQQKLKFVNKK